MKREGRGEGIGRGRVCNRLAPESSHRKAKGRVKEHCLLRTHAMATVSLKSEILAPCFLSQSLSPFIPSIFFFSLFFFLFFFL